MADEPIQNDELIAPDVFDNFNESAQKALDYVNQLDAGLKQLGKTANQSIQNNPLKTTGDIQKFNSDNQQLINTEKAHNEVLKQKSILTQQLTRDEILEREQRRISNKQIADEVKGQISAYAELSLKQREAAQVANDNAASDIKAGRAFSEKTIASQKYANQLNDDLKKIDAANGRYTRSVGNYASALQGTILTFRGLRGPVKLLGEALGIGAYEADNIRLAIEHSLQGYAAYRRQVDATTKAKQAQTEAEKINTGVQYENALATEAQGTASIETAGAIEVQTVATEEGTVALQAWKVALIATGIGAFIVLLGLVIEYWKDIKAAITGVSREQQALNKINDDAVEAYTKEIDAIQSLLDNVNNLNLSYEERIKNLTELKAKGNPYLDGLNLENSASKEQAKNIQAATDKLIEQQKIKGAQSDYDKAKAESDLASQKHHREKVKQLQEQFKQEEFERRQESGANFVPLQMPDYDSMNFDNDNGVFGFGGVANKVEQTQIQKTALDSLLKGQTKTPKSSAQSISDFKSNDEEKLAKAKKESKEELDIKINLLNDEFEAQTLSDDKTFIQGKFTNDKYRAELEKHLRDISDLRTEYALRDSKLDTESQITGIEAQYKSRLLYETDYQQKLYIAKLQGLENQKRIEEKGKEDTRAIDIEIINLKSEYIAWQENTLLKKQEDIDKLQIDGIKNTLEKQIATIKLGIRNLIANTDFSDPEQMAILSLNIKNAIDTITKDTILYNDKQADDIAKAKLASQTKHGKTYLQDEIDEIKKETKAKIDAAILAKDAGALILAQSEGDAKIRNTINSSTQTQDDLNIKGAKANTLGIQNKNATSLFPNQNAEYKAQAAEYKTELQKVLDDENASYEDRLLAAQEYNAKIIALNKKRTDAEIEQLKSVSDETFKRLSDSLDYQQKVNQQKLDLTDKQLQQQLILQSTGQKNTASALLAQQAAEGAKQAALTKEQNRIKEAEQLAQIILKFIEANASKGSAAIPIGITEGLAAKGAVDAIAGSAYEGTEDTGGSGNIDGKGGKLWILHPHEGVATRKANEENPGLIGAMNKGIVDEWIMKNIPMQPLIIDKSPKQIVNEAQNKMLASKIEALTKVMKDKREITQYFNSNGEITKEIIVEAGKMQTVLKPPTAIIKNKHANFSNHK